MNQEKINQLTRALHKLSPIPATELEAAIPYFEEKTIKKGAYFIQQGQTCRHIAFILEGTLRSYYLNEKGEETTSCFCTESNLATSYKSLSLQQASTLTMQALEDTELLLLEYDHLQQLYASSPAWQAIGRAVAEREYFVMEAYASTLNTQTAKEKYLKLLAEQPTVLQIASVEDIASYLGVSRRTLSRIRQELSRTSI